MVIDRNRKHFNCTADERDTPNSQLLKLNKGPLKDKVLENLHGFSWFHKIFTAILKWAGSRTSISLNYTHKTRNNFTFVVETSLTESE